MEKTIAAISTAMSASGIGIIRISGENAMDVISRIFSCKSPRCMHDHYQNQENLPNVPS